MEDLSFDISGLLSEEEANKLFENADSVQEEATETENERPAEETEVEETESSEEVGVEENETGSDAIAPTGDGSSPKFYSSIASALKNDGIFPDFDDSDIDAVNSPEDFAELFEKAVSAKLTEKQKRIDEALGNGVEPNTVRMYEQTLQYLGSINEEALSSESEEGENLRKQLIYNDLINRGYSQEKAQKEIEKSFRAGSDVDDAKDALAALNKYYRAGYENIQNEAKKKAEAFKEERKKEADQFKKMVLEDGIFLGDTKLDKRTCQRVFDAVSKPVHKDAQTGQLLTEIQKYQKENPLEFLKQIGMWYVLTDGGKNMNGFVKEQVRSEKNKNIKELERKINSSSINPDGSLRYTSSTSADGDPLLSDGWNVGWK